MQVCVPSTPAQVYHMLRRQALRGMRRPLVVMSPKSLLRHPLAVSSMDELANGTSYAGHRRNRRTRSASREARRTVLW